MRADAEVGVVAGFNGGDGGETGDGCAVRLHGRGGERVGDEDDIAEADGSDVLSESDKWVQVLDGKRVFTRRESGCVVRR